MWIRAKSRGVRLSPSREIRRDPWNHSYRYLRLIKTGKFLTWFTSISTTVTVLAILSTSWPERYSFKRVPKPIIGISHTAHIGIEPKLWKYIFIFLSFKSIFTFGVTLIRRRTCFDQFINTFDLSFWRSGYEGTDQCLKNIFSNMEK